LQVGAAGVLWGTGGLTVTLLHERQGLAAMSISAWRMAIATIALVGFAAWTSRSRLVATTLRSHPVLAVVIGTGTAVYQALYFLSVLLVGVSVATVVSMGLAPILTSAWEHAMSRSRPTAPELAILACALSGLALVTAATEHGRGATDDQTTLGLVLAGASAATFALTTVMGHTLAQRVDAVALTTCATAAGAVALSPFLVIATMAGEPVLANDPGSWVLLLYLGVVTMALAYGLLFSGLRTTSGSAATVATLVEPISAALLAVLLLGERLTWTTLAGGVLILVAVAALHPSEERPAPV
jgi:DME family drug/metabolite transporter